MKLNQLADIRTGLVLSRKKGDVHDEHYFTYQAVTLKAFTDKGILAQEALDTFIAKESISEKYLTKEGDILVRLRTPSYAVYIDKECEGMIVPSFVAHLNVLNGDAMPLLTHYLNALSTQRELQKKAKGTAISMIKTKDLGELDINLPSLEQQKRLCTLLQLADREADLLETLKMQKIAYKNQILDTIIKQGNN